jgi:hypothetical protein
VNGGAFAIAKVLSEKPNALNVMGSLHLQQLAAGMMAFTILLVFDIYMFAEKMKRLQGNCEPKIFAVQGKLVLFTIGTLICLAWLMGGIL